MVSRQVVRVVSEGTRAHLLGFMQERACVNVFVCLRRGGVAYIRGSVFRVTGGVHSGVHVCSLCDHRSVDYCCISNSIKHELAQ